MLHPILEAAMTTPWGHHDTASGDGRSLGFIPPSPGEGDIVICSARPNVNDIEQFLEQELVADGLATVAVPDGGVDTEPGASAEWMCAAISRILATPLTRHLAVALLGVREALPGMLLCASRSPTMLGALVSINGVSDGVESHALACIDVPVLLLTDRDDLTAQNAARSLRMALRCKQRSVQVSGLLTTHAGRTRLIEEALAWVALHLSEPWMHRRYIHGAAVATMP
jgi:hypothetical protein